MKQKKKEKLPKHIKKITPTIAKQLSKVYKKPTKFYRIYDKKKWRLKRKKPLKVKIDKYLYIFLIECSYTEKRYRMAYHRKEHYMTIVEEEKLSISDAYVKALEKHNEFYPFHTVVNIELSEIIITTYPFYYNRSDYD